MGNEQGKQLGEQLATARGALAEANMQWKLEVQKLDNARDLITQKYDMHLETWHKDKARLEADIAKEVAQIAEQLKVGDRT